MIIRVMVAVADPRERSRLEHVVDALGPVTLLRGDPRRLWDALRVSDVDLVITDQSVLPPEPAPWFAGIAALPEHPEVIVLTNEESPEARGAILAAGALAVLHHGLPEDTLSQALTAMVERRRQAESGATALRPQDRPSLSDFAADSDSMRTFLSMVRRVAASNSSVLILGETGVGKERLARSLHAEGARADGPFVAVNCGALPESLLEAELFGHEQGAFTGATRSRRGYFELAHGGSLFLDEIGEVPLHLQVKLLRALEERRIRRVGSEQTVPVDTRIIAATNRNLDEEVAAGRFRPDLFYRLAVVTLTVPSLRERREDIPLLVNAYLERFRLETPGCVVRGVTPAAMESLRVYDWPGNVRELINVIERGVLLCQREEIDVDDLPRSISRLPAEHGAAEAGTTRALLDRPLADARRRVIQTFERSYLAHLLGGTGGRIREAAEKAGVDERTIYNLMRRHGLRKEKFKPRAPRSRRSA